MSYFDDVMDLIEKYSPLPEKKVSKLPQDQGVPLENEAFEGQKNFMWWIKQEHL